jgi:hypothetical protein
MNFESAVVPALPNCTSAVNNGTGNIWTVANAPGNGFTTKALQYLYNFANPADTWFFTQGVNLTAGISYRIKYNYGSNSSSYVENLKVAYGASPSSGAMTNTLFDHTITTAGIQANQIDFVPTTTGVYYFGYQAFSIANQYYIYVDNIEVLVTPACSAPINLAVSNLTSNSTTVSWSTIASALTYEYVSNTTLADPTAAGTIQTAITINLTGLLPSTQYYFHVRTNCSGTDSAWSTITYTTLATPPPNNECANAQVLTPGGAFATNPVVGTNIGTTSSAGNPAPACASYQGGDVFYSVVVPASGSITIETNSNAGGTITDTGMEVYSGVCGTLTFIECDDDDSADGFFSLISLTGRTPGEVLIIRVWEYGNDAFGTFKVSAYDASLGSDSFNNSNFTYYPNPVKDVLNITYSATIQNVQVINLIGQQVRNQEFNATNGSVDLSNLPSGAYLVKVTTENGEKTIKVMKE